MSILGYKEPDLMRIGAIHTATEISGQPGLWMKTYEKFELEKNSIGSFLNGIIPSVGMVILTGAGTSAFIGLSLKGCWSRLVHPNTQVVATTDLVTHPLDFISSETPLLLVSFARSGNSPESVAAVILADKICKTCYHLIITCDKQGELARYKSQSKKYIFLLPEQANDLGLAMTGSYTGMLLSGLLIARYRHNIEQRPVVERICKYGERILNEYSGFIQQAATLNFKRAVFIGSGPLFGTSTESHLKLQELTDGEIVCKNDSFLGIRHGPKAVIDEGTLLVFLLSNDPYVMKYEQDFMHSLQKGKKAMFTMAISEKQTTGMEFDLNIFLTEDGEKVEEEFLSVCDIIPGQLLGFYKSLALGLKPDSPSESGAISRVVEGVKIYDFI